LIYHPEVCNGLVKRRRSTASQHNLRPPRDDARVTSVVYRSFKNVFYPTNTTTFLSTNSYTFQPLYGHPYYILN
jgi:hypothetical protein